MGKKRDRSFPSTEVSPQQKKVTLSTFGLVWSIPKKSIFGNQYFISFIENFSRFNMLYFLKKKCEAFQAFTIIIPWLKTNVKVKLAALGQIMVENMSKMNGIISAMVTWHKHEFNVPHNPQKSGVA